VNLKTGIMLILFCVALGGVIVGQRLQIRSVAFDAGALEKDLGVQREQQRVLGVELARKCDPKSMMVKVREAGLNLIPPDKPDPVPEAPKGRRNQ
jgi:hypothetical protein